MKGVILDADSLGKGEIHLDEVTGQIEEWQVYGYTEPDETALRISDAEVVLTNKVVLDQTLIRNARSIRYIGVMATGTNNIDLDAAASRHIVVSNARGYATPSVVQHTINLMLNLATGQPDYIQDVRAGNWQRSKVFCLLDRPIVELEGKTLGIIGYGELGSHVASVARAFGMDILIASRPGNNRKQRDRIPLGPLLEQVDFLSLHCPLTPETEKLIDHRALARMKPSAFLINTARGGLVDSEALVNALAERTIAGAAVDVLEVEPPSGREPLTTAGMPNLIVTPHNAWGAIESRRRLIRQMAENLRGFLCGKPCRVVN